MKGRRRGSRNRPGETTNRGGRPAETISYSYPVGQILTCRNALAEVLKGEFAGKILEGPSFQRLVDIVHEGLPGPPHYETVYESCRHLAGVPLTPQLLHDTAHRLAGNLPRLRRRRPVLPWVVQKMPEWVPVHILGCRSRLGPKNQPGAVLDFKIMAGSPCPLRMRRWWSLSFCRYHATLFGFSRPASDRSSYPAKYPFTVAAQLVNLRLYVLIQPDRCELGRPDFDRIKVPGSVHDWNREQLRYRFRVDPGYVCPDGHPREFGCQRCPRGYESCRAAVHALDYVFKPCPGCDQERAPFDPEWGPKALCVNCENLAQSLRRS